MMDKLVIEIKDSVEEAPNYNKMEEKFNTLILQKAIVVRRGTVNGNDTVDLQLIDLDGNKYVALVKASHLKLLANFLIVDSSMEPNQCSESLN